MDLFKQYKGLRKENYILCLGRMVTNMGAMIWPVLTLILNQKLGMSATQISIITVISGVIVLPAGIIGGKLADRFNKKMIIVYADMVSVIFFIVAAIMPLSLVTVALLLLGSSFQSLENPAYIALIADITKTEDRERAYSLSYLGANLGLVASPTIAGLLFKNHLNLSFIISGLSIGCSTLLILFLVKDITKVVSESVEEAYQQADEKASIWKIFRDNKLILFYTIVMSMFWATYSEWSYLAPLNLGRVHGENGALIYGTITSVNCVVVVVLTPVLTKVFEKLKKTVQIFIGTLLLVAGFVIFSVALGCVPFYYVAVTLLTLGEIAVVIASTAYATERIPSSHRGRVNGAMGFAQNSMYGVIMLLTGVVYDGYGHVWAWVMVIALQALVALGAFYMIGEDKKVYPLLYK